MCKKRFICIARYLHVGISRYLFRLLSVKALCGSWTNNKRFYLVDLALNCALILFSHLKRLPFAVEVRKHTSAKLNKSAGCVCIALFQAPCFFKITTILLNPAVITRRIGNKPACLTLSYQRVLSSLQVI